jgi:hypothetical protein
VQGPAPRDPVCDWRRTEAVALGHEGGRIFVPYHEVSGQAGGSNNALPSTLSPRALRPVFAAHP